MNSQNMNIPTNGYTGSDRARKAASSAIQKGGGMHTPMVGETPKAMPASPADKGNSLQQNSNPKVLPTMTKPAKGATPPMQVNPMQRPGLKANKFNKGATL